MERRSLRLAATVGLVVTTLASTAFAKPKDRAAMKLYDQAIEEDYLETNFDGAIGKLDKAIQTCGKDNCSDKVLAQLYVGLGTVEGVGKGNQAAAKKAFVNALEAYSRAELIEGFATDELKEIFAAAKKDARSGGQEPSGPSEPSEPREAGGDMDYAPPEEALVNTPLPIYIEVDEGIGADKVKLRYKPFGGTKWTSVNMLRIGEGYGGVIPCKDLTTTGKVRFYIIIMDADGVPIATAGSLKSPHFVRIKHEIAGDQPSLPGKEPPEKCVSKADCPPGFPGCGDKAPPSEERGDKGWGASCEETQECRVGFICLNGSCEQGEEEPGDADGPAGDFAKNWISLGFQFDLMAISSAENVCTGEHDNYFCYFPEGEGEFRGVPLDDKFNQIQGGLGFASIRFLLGYDRVLWKGLVGGARLGFALGGSPSPGDQEEQDGLRDPAAQPFLPLHAEARAQYFFLPDAFQRDFRPYGFIGAGVANVNAGVSVAVCDTRTKDGQDISGIDDGCENDDNDPAKKRELEGYQVSGLGFAGFGAGVQYRLHDNFALQGEVKLMVMFPTVGFALAPTISPVVMF